MLSTKEAKMQQRAARTGMAGLKRLILNVVASFIRRPAFIAE